MATTDERDWVAEVGAPAWDSIREMVAALECDYERLEELWELKREYAEDGANGNWLDDCADDAAELKELEDAAGDCTNREDAYERIQEDALSIEVRSGWVSLGDGMTADEFRILLTTGGPAVQIMGGLDSHGEPCRAWLEVQDWGKPWSQYFPADHAVLLTYAEQFFQG